MAGTPSFWNDDNTAEAKKLWLDGYSAAQIADRLHCVSRNAVIGRLHRIGLTGKDGGVPKTAARPRQRRSPTASSKRLVSARLAVANDAAIELPAAAPVSTICFATDSAPTSLLDLTLNSCRWPIGDPSSPSFGFCGAVRLDPFDLFNCYCAQHTRIAYTPARRRNGHGEVVVESTHA